MKIWSVVGLIAFMLASGLSGCQRAGDGSAEQAAMQASQPETPDIDVSGEWTSTGGDAGNTKYSPLDQINRENVRDLKVAWRWTPVSQERIAGNDSDIECAEFKPTPLAIDGVLYISTSLSQVVAIDAGSGQTLWEHDPESYKAGKPAMIGFQHRGVAYWSKASERRIFIATHDRKLIALHAQTGQPCADFGVAGIVDLGVGLGRAADPEIITHGSPPGICRDTVIVGSTVADNLWQQTAPPGHVRGYDAQTGRLKWTFHTIAQEGEVGNETWEGGSWQHTGACNVWSMFSADEELGYVYLPVTTPNNDMYGGHRLGDNLFAESLVCLDAETGKRVWHFQTVHHGLWDYDLPTPPNLVDLAIDGKVVKAVAQVSKQAFCYVFNRVTGEPLWPIEERPVPSSTVPGERSAPTQPFPTKPAPYDRQGFSEDDLIDFTPELNAKARELAKLYSLGPLFTPPSLEGTLGLPGPNGGTNWQGAAVDPETGILYVPSQTNPFVFRVMEPETPSDLKYHGAYYTPGQVRLGIISAWDAPSRLGFGLSGLPIVKPPYSRVTAIDLKTGEHVWMTPHGDGPRNHALLKNLNLAPLGEPGGMGGPLVTKTLLFVAQRASGIAGSNAKHNLTVFDKTTGELLGTIALPSPPHGIPVTYLHDGKQYIAISVGGGDFSGRKGTQPELIAFALR